MTDATSIPGLADPQAGGSPVQGEPPPSVWRGSQGALSDEDVLALLDGLGVAGTHGPEEEQEAILEAEIAARDADIADIVASGRNGAEGAPVSPVLVAEHLPDGPGLAAMLAANPPANATDWDLPGLAAGYRKLAAWAQARELAAAAEIAGRRAAANRRIGANESGRPVSLPPEAAAEVALELVMSQYGASVWTSLGCRLRWDLPATGTALATGSIDLGRARIIAEATTGLSRGHAAQVEARVLPHAAGQTTGQLRAAARRAVLAIDPDGADQRRRDTEQHAKISLYPGEEGTATLTGSCLPGLQAAAAMARITAMARALKSSGADGGLDLLRAHIYLGLLLGTMPLIPPPPDAPPDNPAPPGGEGPDGRESGGPHAGDEGPGTDHTGSGAHDNQPPAARERGPSNDPDDGTAASPDNGTGHDSPASQAGSGPASSDVRSHGADDLPGWWPDIPPPTDTDAPPDDGGPPDRAWTQAGAADDGDECDRAAQSPPPAWPQLPAQLPAAPAAARTGDRAGQATARPGATGLLDVLVPWTALAGHTCEAGILGRIGPISSWQARQLAAMAARSPATQWRVIITDDNGRALAVERCLPRQRGPGGLIRPPTHGQISQTVADATTAGAASTGTVGRITITIRASHLGTANAMPRPTSPRTVQQVAPMVLAAAARAAARADARAQHDVAAADGCAHVMASGAYRPPARIREYVAARDCTCRFGPCGQPAWRTDLDHTIPWHHGGRTCPCNLGGCCRTHHKIKQLPGWRLEQPQPGTFRWTTPSGRSYPIQPDRYP